MNTNASLNEREALFVLNQDFNHFKRRVEDLESQIKRGNERFAKIDIHEHGIEAAINGLRADFSRAMVAIERMQTQLQTDDKGIGTALRLANQVQLENAELQRVIDTMHISDEKIDKRFDKLERSMNLFMIAHALVLLAVFSFLLMR